MNYLKYKIIDGAVPFSLKKKMIRLRTYTSRLPYAIAYHGLEKAGITSNTKIGMIPSLMNPQVYWIDFDKIQFQGVLKNQQGRLSFGGAWDINNIYPYISIFEEAPETAKCWDVHETMRHIFLFGKEYQQSPQYKSMMKSLAENKLSSKFKLIHTIEDIHAYFNRLKAAYRSMEKHGFLTQKEQGKISDWEVEIYVTRDGKLCVGKGGNHRVRMAELLRVKQIPVTFKGIHPLWIEKLSHQFSLPPHKAVLAWLQQEFYLEKPKQVSTVKSQVLH